MQGGRSQTAYDEKTISGRLAVLGLAVASWLVLALFAVVFFGAASVDGNEFSGGRRMTLAFMILWGVGITASMAMLPSLRRPGDRVSAVYSAVRTGAWTVAVGGLAAAVLVVGTLLVL